MVLFYSILLYSILFYMYFHVLFCPMTVLLDSIWLVQFCGSILFYNILYVFSVLFCPMTVLLDSIWLVQFCGSILFYSILLHCVQFYMVMYGSVLSYACFVGFYMVRTILCGYFLFYSIIYSTLLYCISIYMVIFCSVLSCDCALLDFIQACSILHISVLFCSII